MPLTRTKTLKTNPELDLKKFLKDVLKENELTDLFKKTNNGNTILHRDSRRNVLIYNLVANLKVKNNVNIEKIITNVTIFKFLDTYTLYSDGFRCIGYKKIIGTDTYGVTYITLINNKKKKFYMLITPKTATENISLLYNNRVFASNTNISSAFSNSAFSKLINDFKKHGLLNDDQCTEILGKNVGTLDTNKLNGLIKQEYLYSFENNPMTSARLSKMNRDLLTYYLIINLIVKSKQNIKKIKKIMNYTPVSIVLLSELVGYEFNGGVLLLTFKTIMGFNYIVLTMYDDNVEKELNLYVKNKKTVKEIKDTIEFIDAKITEDNDVLLNYYTIVGLQSIILKKNDNNFDKQLSLYVNNKNMVKTIKSQMNRVTANAGAKYTQYCYES